MPQQPPQISDAEWEVMKALWTATAPLTAGQVVQVLESTTAWRPRTIKTLLARLVRKGAARADPVAGDAQRTCLYRAAVTRESCVRRASRSFLARVFDGDATPALLHFLKTADLSRDEIDQLKRLLDENNTSGGGKERKP